MKDLLGLSGNDGPPKDESGLTVDELAALDRFYNGDKATPPRGLLESAVDRRAAELWDTTGATEAERQQLRSSLVGLKKTGLNEATLITIAEAAVDNHLADARPIADKDAAAQELEQQAAAWATEARQMLRNTYGNDAEQMLARTKKFVGAHPELAKILQQRGLGSRPDVVESIAAHVFSTGYGAAEKR